MLKKNINSFLNTINRGAAEVVQLPNGDVLKYHHVKHLFQDIPQAWDNEKEIVYSDLKLIENQCKQKISIHQLVDNINDFKRKMFPENTNQAALAEEAEHLIPSPKIDLAGGDAQELSNATERVQKIQVLKEALKAHEEDFNGWLRDLKDKRDELDLKAKTDPEYTIIARDVNNLCLALDKYKNFFEQPSAILFQEFGKECMLAITLVKKNAPNHRGWYKTRVSHFDKNALKYAA